MSFTRATAFQLFLTNEGFVYDGYESVAGHLIYVKEAESLGMLIYFGDEDNYYSIVKFDEEVHIDGGCDYESFDNLKELLAGYNKFQELVSQAVHLKKLMSEAESPFKIEPL